MARCITARRSRAKTGLNRHSMKRRAGRGDHEWSQWSHWPWLPPLLLHPLDLPPLPRSSVAEVAGAEEGVERLGQAVEVGVHARRDVAGGFGAERGDQAHR